MSSSESCLLQTIWSTLLVNAWYTRFGSDRASYFWILTISRCSFWPIRISVLSGQLSFTFSSGLVPYLILTPRRSY